MLGIRQDGREDRMECAVNGCEELCAAEHPSGPALRHKDAIGVQLGLHHISVKVLCIQLQHSRACVIVMHCACLLNIPANDGNPQEAHVLGISAVWTAWLHTHYDHQGDTCWLKCCLSAYKRAMCETASLHAASLHGGTLCTSVFAVPPTVHLHAGKAHLSQQDSIGGLQASCWHMWSVSSLHA